MMVFVIEYLKKVDCKKTISRQQKAWGKSAEILDRIGSKNIHYIGFEV